MAHHRLFQKNAVDAAAASSQDRVEILSSNSQRLKAEVDKTEVAKNQAALGTFSQQQNKEYTGDLKRLSADLEGVSSAQTTLGNAEMLTKDAAETAGAVGEAQACRLEEAPPAILEQAEVEKNQVKSQVMSKSDILNLIADYFLTEASKPDKEAQKEQFERIAGVLKKDAAKASGAASSAAGAAVAAVAPPAESLLALMMAHEAETGTMHMVPPAIPEVATLTSRIKTIEQEIKGYVEKIFKRKDLDPAETAAAHEAMKKKKMFEQQRDHLLGTQQHSMTEDDLAAEFARMEEDLSDHGFLQNHLAEVNFLEHEVEHLKTKLAVSEQAESERSWQVNFLRHEVEHLKTQLRESQEQCANACAAAEAWRQEVWQWQQWYNCQQISRERYLM